MRGSPPAYAKFSRFSEWLVLGFFGEFEFGLVDKCLYTSLIYGYDMQANTNEITPTGGAGGNASREFNAVIGVRPDGIKGLKVVLAFLWDGKHERDFPGAFEGMIGAHYDDADDVVYSARRVVSDYTTDDKDNTKVYITLVEADVW